MGKAVKVFTNKIDRDKWILGYKLRGYQLGKMAYSKIKEGHFWEVEMVV